MTIRMACMPYRSLPRVRMFLSACAIIALLLGGVYIFYASTYPEFYVESLRERNITQQVEVDGISYTVDRGEVSHDGGYVARPIATRALTLAYEKSVAERAPLIALAGTDPAVFDIAVQDLDETLASLAALQDAPRMRTLVRDALYPLDFLKRAGELEASRLAFISSGSDIDAKLYRAVSIRAVDAFQSDLKKFERAFTEVVPTDAPPYIMVNKYSDYKTVMSVLDELRRGIDESERRLNARARCFNGFFRACHESDIDAPRLEIPDLPVPVSSTLLEYVRSKFSRPPLSLKLEDMDPAHAVLFQLTDPGCTLWGDEAQLYTMRTAHLNNVTYRNPIMLTADRLVNATRQRNIPFFRFFDERGVTYITSSPFVYYECVYNARDLGKLLAMDTIVAASAQDTMATGERRGLAQRFAARTQPITERDTTRYAELVAYEGKFDLALAVQNRSAGYDSQLLNISGLEKTNARLYSWGLPVGLTAVDLFYTRNALAALLMMDNMSVSGDHDHAYPTAPATQQPYVYYTALTPAEKKKADADQQFYFLLHNDPSFAQRELNR